MSSLLEARQAIADGLRDAIGAVKSVEAHGGSYTGTEVLRWSDQAPSIRVACLGVPSVDYTSGENVAQAQWGAFVLTKGQGNAPAQRRDAEALAIISAMINAMRSNTWGKVFRSPPEAITVRNEYRPELDKKGISLWAVTWRQAVDVLEFSLNDLVDLERVVTTYDMDTGAAADNTSTQKEL